jgi:hypothetical protein
MSIFNVGTGREPAEIGVAEYQKPDYQQFEKLANVNMALKQQELEKAQKKTKEWGDILNTDFSTKYAVEQSQYVQKNIQSIKDDLMKDVSKNPDLLNDPTTIMQVKARLNQVKGYVKTLDEQAENIIKQKSEFEKDTKGIAYDKQYGKEYFEAQDNPIEFYKNNPDSEVGKTLGVIINSPQIQAITDPDQKRFAIRASLQALPMKEGTIRIQRKTEGKPLQDISRPYADKSGKRTTYDEVSPVSALVFTMNAHRNGANENMTYREYTKRELIKQTGEAGYNDYLSKLKDDYINNYNAMAKEYAGEEITMGKFNELPKPENLTEGDLLDYAWGKPESANFTTKTARESQTTNVSVRTGEGSKTKTTSGTTNTRLKVPSLGKGFGNLDMTTTVIDPVDKTQTVPFNNVYTMDGTGNLIRLESSTTTGNLTAPMGQVQTTLVPVYLSKTYNIPSGGSVPSPLTEADREDMVKNPNKWKGKVKFMTAFISNSITTQYGKKKIDSAIAFAKDDQNALNLINTEAKQQGYSGFYPTENEYSLEDGLNYYNQHKKISTPKRAIKRTK